MVPLRSGKRSKLELKVWSYGIGEEGVKDSPGKLKRINVVIVDHEYPWWYGSARSVDFNVTNIWLNSYMPIDLTHIEDQQKMDILIETGVEPSAKFIKAMHQSDVMLVNGTVPESLERENLWSVETSAKLKAVIYTEASRHQPGKPWKTYVHKIKHSDVGGITDGTFSIRVTKRDLMDGDEAALVINQHIQQDLRWTLKPNEEGKLSKPPPPQEALGRANWYQKDILHEASLLPWNMMGCKVITRYRHNQWVIRQLTLVEKLLSLDVPEQLIKSNPSDEARTCLLNSVKVPLKILQIVVEHYAQMLRRKLPTLPDDMIVRGKRGCEISYVDTVRRQSRARLNTSQLSLGLPSINELRPENFDRVAIKENSNIRPHITEPVKYDENAVATKSDDAEVRTELWDKQLVNALRETVSEKVVRRSLMLLRKHCLIYWKWKVLRSFNCWVTNQENLKISVSKKEIEAGKDCCRRAFGSSWWSWDAGSRPFFWRWPVTYRSAILHGVPVWFEEPVNKWRRRQREPKNQEVRELMKEKLNVIRKKGYVEDGKIDSFMSFFDVPKGKDDIRMVYDGSKSGLNDSLWAPWFPLPTVDCLVRALEPGYYMADNDVGEMFHNFMLHSELRKYCGLDLTLFFNQDVSAVYHKGNLWERWNRLAMGLRNSPYNAIQGMMVAKEMILGDPTDKDNVFRWKSVRMNLPGSETYDPSKAWIAKVREDGTVAADVFIYVDDVRSSASSEEEAWKAAQQTSSTLGYLGLQDAARKRRQPGQEAGAWTGSVAWTSNGHVVVLTTQEKWDKAKGHIQWIADNLNNKDGLDNKMLKSIRGFLVYVARTYCSMVPYLKGLHATIDSWRAGRNVDGWKYADQRKWTEDPDPIEYDSRFGIVTESPNEPRFVFPVPRLAADVRCLAELTRYEKPPHRKVRMGREGRVVYGFGDASKQGFGTSVELSDGSIIWRSGEFSTLVKEKSSNYRELLNLVEYIESVYAKGLLDGCELFMFTDNSTAEAAYFKGTSSSELLFELVLRLRRIEMEGRCLLHMVHVAGTRMISQGTDGLSRGDRHAGIMAGQSMLTFLPLHRSANEQSDLILPWINTWACGEEEQTCEIKILTCADWYKPITTCGVYVWIPAPAIADVAGELMAQAIHKNPYATHILLCPRLMTARWMRLILKATDATWRIPAGSPCWDITNHEPLVLSIYFSLSRQKPWRHSRCAQFGHESKVVQTLLSSGATESGVALRKLVTRTRNLAGL